MLAAGKISGVEGFGCAGGTGGGGGKGGVGGAGGGCITKLEGKYPPLTLALVPTEMNGSERSVMAEGGVGPSPLYSLAPSKVGPKLPAGTISATGGLRCARGVGDTGGEGGVGGCGAGLKWGESVPSSACWTTGPVDGVSGAGEGSCAASNASAARMFEVVFDRVSSNRVGGLRDLKRLVKQVAIQLPGIAKDGPISL